MVSVPEYISLGQAIDFHNEFGSLLIDGIDRIEAIKDPLVRDLETLAFEIEQAYCLASFFSDMTLPELQETMPVFEVLEIYRNRLQPLYVTEGDGFNTVS